MFKNKQHSTINNQCSGKIVPKEGIEPSHPKIHDFESCASTSSATLAWLRQRLDNNRFKGNSVKALAKKGANMGKVYFLDKPMEPKAYSVQLTALFRDITT